MEDGVSCQAINAAMEEMEEMRKRGNANHFYISSLPHFHLHAHRITLSHRTARQAEQQRRQRGDEQQAVEAIQNSAMPRHDPSEVLDANLPF